MKKIIYISIISILIFSSYSMAQQQDLWINFNTADGLADKTVLAIFESSDGALWFGTEGGGVNRYQDKTWTTFDTTDGLAGNFVSAICESRDGALWFGTGIIGLANKFKISEMTEFPAMFGKGVSRYHNGIWTTYNTDSGLVNDDVKAICKSSDGALWFATSAGISQYQNGIWTSWLTDKMFWTAGKSSDQALWFGTINGGGLIRYQNGIWTTFTTADGLAGNSVWSICESHDGVLWFGTSSGVSRYQDGIWYTYTTAHGMADNWIKAITESSDGTMWFGTGGGGVSQYYAGIWTTITTADGLARDNVWSICESGDGAMWFGTNGGGVSQLYPSPWRTFTTADGLADNTVYAIGESDDRALWFATSFGVSSYHGTREQEWMTFTTAGGLAHNNVQAIYRSSNGAMCFGTYGGGVSQYHEWRWTTFNTDSGLASNNVLQSLILTNGSQFVVTPTYYVYEMFMPHRDSQLIHCEVENSPILKLNQKPSISVSASKSIKNHNEIFLSIVNLDLSNDFNIEIKNMIGSEMTILEVKLLACNNVRDFNSFDDPKMVAPKILSIQNLEALSIPAHSVLTLTLKIK